MFKNKRQKKWRGKDVETFVLCVFFSIHQTVLCFTIPCSDYLEQKCNIQPSKPFPFQNFILFHLLYFLLFLYSFSFPSSLHSPSLPLSIIFSSSSDILFFLISNFLESAFPSLSLVFPSCFNMIEGMLFHSLKKRKRKWKTSRNFPFTPRSVPFLSKEERTKTIFTLHFACLSLSKKVSLSLSKKISLSLSQRKSLWLFSL